jgi:hypothetical protein
MARLNRDTFKPLMLAVLLVGIALLVFGLFRFASNAQALQDSRNQTAELEATLRQQIDANGGQANPGDPATDAAGRMLFSASMGQRKLEGDMWQGAIIMGVGVIVLALGWLGYDMLRGKRKADSEPAVEADKPIRLANGDVIGKLDNK